MGQTGAMALAKQGDEAGKRSAGGLAWSPRGLAWSAFGVACSALGLALWGGAAAVAGSAALATMAACETQKLYVECKLDDDVTKKGICSGSKSADKDTSSCVVREHPQCDQSVCLSYFGLTPFCTTTCSDANDGVCGNDAFCWTFSDADPVTKSTKQQYCVPNAKKVEAGQK